MRSVVQHFRSEYTSNPVMDGTLGLMITIFDACLVNGLDLQQAWITPHPTISTKAVVLLASGSVTKETQLLTVTGANESLYNGIFRSEGQYLATNTFVITVGAGQPVGGATGTLSSRKTPIGLGAWSKIATPGVNKAVYKSSDCNWVLYVDDSTSIASAEIVIASGWNGTSLTGLRTYPRYIAKNNGQQTDGTANDWLLIGDNKTIHYASTYSSQTSYEYLVASFGDYIPLVGNEVPYVAASIGFGTNVYQHSYGVTPNFAGTPAYIERLWDITGGSPGTIALTAKTHVLTHGPLTSPPGVASGYGVCFPEPFTNAVLIADYILTTGINILHEDVGLVPGMYCTPQASSNMRGYITTGLDTNIVAGGALLSIPHTATSAALHGSAVFDVIGPWS